MIELPTDFITNLTASANEQIANFSPLLILVLGLLLAVAVLGALIGFIRK